jgi:hypothetical protein
MALVSARRPEERALAVIETWHEAPMNGERLHWERSRAIGQAKDAFQ